MDNYSVTFGYKAVIEIAVKADSEQEAKDKAAQIFEKKVRGKISSGNVILNDDKANPAGITNMSKSWDLLY